MVAQSDGQIAREDAAAARRAADAAVASVGEIVHRLDVITAGVTDTRIDLQRIETIAREGRDQAVKTNGRVTALESWVVTMKVWQGELRGIAQGSGGTGRLFVYVLTSAAATGGIITAAMKILEY